MNIKKINKGFTLLELLVVIGIIGILVSIGSVAYTSAQARGRDTKRRGDLDAISKAIEQYNAENNGLYPNNADCTGYEAYLGSGTPTDPKYGFVYTSTTANTMSGGSGSFCSTTAFCVCDQLEATNTGNAYGRSGTSCTFTGSGNKNYYCVRNLQ
jgi:type IV pilus assembly protein PilE